MQLRTAHGQGAEQLLGHREAGQQALKVAPARQLAAGRRWRRGGAPQWQEAAGQGLIGGLVVLAAASKWPLITHAVPAEGC